MNKDTLDQKMGCFSKLTWQSQEEAKAAIAYSGFRYGYSGSKPKAYNCNYCGKWHLTRNHEN